MVRLGGFQQPCKPRVPIIGTHISSSKIKVIAENGVGTIKVGNRVLRLQVFRAKTGEQSVARAVAEHVSYPRYLRGGGKEGLQRFAKLTDVRQKTEPRKHTRETLSDEESCEKFLLIQKHKAVND